METLENTKATAYEAFEQLWLAHTRMDEVIASGYHIQRRYNERCWPTESFPCPYISECFTLDCEA